jgi:hypothetical protein
VPVSRARSSKNEAKTKLGKNSVAAFLFAAATSSRCCLTNEHSVSEDKLLVSDQQQQRLKLTF